MKPLDIVRTPNGFLAMVTEVGTRETRQGIIWTASIQYLKGQPNAGQQKSAWWDETEGLEVLDSIPNLMASAMYHPFGVNKDQGDRFFPIDK